MGKDKQSMVIDRGMALHKMIRLITMSLGGESYLTFMGNEFGHPEWIDFPREGNGWSYHYCRRQWSLSDNPDLKYQYLNAFETAMIKMARKTRLLSGKMQNLWTHQSDKVLMYQRAKTVFAFNFDPTHSFDGYFVPVTEKGEYQVLMDTDEFRFGGQGRIGHQMYTAEKQEDGRIGFRVYLPSRTAIVFKKVPSKKKK